MRLACRNGEGCWHCNRIAGRPSQGIKQCRKAQVITDGKAKPSQRRVLNNAEPVTGLIGFGFAPAFTALQINIEHMHFVICLRGAPICFCVRFCWAIYRAIGPSATACRLATCRDGNGAKRNVDAVLPRSHMQPLRHDLRPSALNPLGRAATLAIEQ